MRLRRQRASTTQADFAGTVCQGGSRAFASTASQEGGQAFGGTADKGGGRAFDNRAYREGRGTPVWSKRPGAFGSTASQEGGRTPVMEWACRVFGRRAGKGGLPCSLCFCLGALPSPPWEKRASRIPILPGSHGVAEGGGRRTPVRSPGSGRRRQGNRRHRVPSDSPPF